MQLYTFIVTTGLAGLAVTNMLTLGHQASIQMMYTQEPLMWHSIQVRDVLSIILS